MGDGCFVCEIGGFVRYKGHWGIGFGCAIRFAIKTSVNCVIIEIDSLPVVKAIQDTAETTSHTRHIIDDVKHLSMALRSCKFHHAKREPN